VEKGDWERVQKELLPSGKVLPAATGALIDIFWSKQASPVPDQAMHRLFPIMKAAFGIRRPASLPCSRLLAAFTDAPAGRRCTDWRTWTSTAPAWCRRCECVRTRRLHACSKLVKQELVNCRPRWDVPDGSDLGGLAGS
jgi:hypothetical protein